MVVDLIEGFVADSDEPSNFAERFEQSVGRSAVKLADADMGSVLAERFFDEAEFGDAAESDIGIAAAADFSEIVAVAVESSVADTANYYFLVSSWPAQTLGLLDLLFAHIEEDLLLKG